MENAAGRARGRETDGDRCGKTSANAPEKSAAASRHMPDIVSRKSHAESAIRRMRQAKASAEKAIRQHPSRPIRRHGAYRLVACRKKAPFPCQSIFYEKTPLAMRSKAASGRAWQNGVFVFLYFEASAATKLLAGFHGGCPESFSPYSGSAMTPGQGDFMKIRSLRNT